MTRLDSETIARAFQNASVSDADDYKVIDANEPLRNCNLAISRDGLAAILVPLPRIASETARLTNAVSLRAVGQLEFANRDRRWTQAAAVIECRDRTLLQTFSAMASALVERLASLTAPTWDAVERLFAEWERLLARRRVLSGESELGLWGELWFLAHSGSRVDTMLEAWRGPEREHVDFVLDGLGLEVKTSRSEGVHMVSHDQLDAPLGDVPVVIASVHVVVDPVRGRSLAAMVRDISTKLVEQASFEEKLAATGYSRDDESAYTRPYAVTQAPRFYDTVGVPRVRLADPGVSRIRYQVELPPEGTLEQGRLAAVVGAIGIDPAQLEYPCA